MGVVQKYRLRYPQSTTPKQTITQGAIARAPQTDAHACLTASSLAPAKTTPMVRARPRNTSALSCRSLVTHFAQRRRRQIDQISVGVDIIEHRGRILSPRNLVCRIITWQRARLLQCREIQRAGRDRSIITPGCRWAVDRVRRLSPCGTARTRKQCQHNQYQLDRTAFKQSRETSKQGKEMQDEAKHLPRQGEGGK